MKKYETFSHAKVKLRYHIIFSTKFRRRCLDGVENELKDSLKYVESVSDFKIENIGIDGDHIHLIVRSRPSMSVSSIVRRLKQITTRQMWKKCNEHLSRFYYERMRGKLWTNGYFCCTLGDVSSRIVEKYVENQG